MATSTKNAQKSQPSHNFKLQALNPCVAGIDIGARSIFVCIGFEDGHQEVREFFTFTRDLKDMVSWLLKNSIQSVAMESTGVYWIPVYDILAQAKLEVTLVNAYYLKTVPGRKTDVKDCQWIQQLHAYGLLRGSFRPDDMGVTFRGYVRQRSRLFELASQQVQLMHKALVQMNLRLHQVVTDITGASGISIIRAIVAGEHDPNKLAKYRNSRLKRAEVEIVKALEGNYRSEHLLCLKHALEAFDFFHSQVLECEKAIEQILNEWKNKQQRESLGTLPSDTCIKDKKKSRVRKTTYNKTPYFFEAEQSLEQILHVDLTEIPGLESNGVMRILAETGSDMSKWPSSKHFASWLGLCPGNKISGGKVLSSKTKPSANKAAQMLRMAANSLHHSKSALGAYFRRMRSRLGAPKAITATAHKLAKLFYTMLREGKGFKEIGQAAYEERFKARNLLSLQKRAKDFGYRLVAC